MIAVHHAGGQGSKPYRDHNILDGKNYADKLVVNNLANVSLLCYPLKSLGGYLGFEDIPGYLLPPCNNFKKVQWIVQNIDEFSIVMYNMTEIMV